MIEKWRQENKNFFSSLKVVFFREKTMNHRTFDIYLYLRTESKANNQTSTQIGFRAMRENERFVLFSFFLCGSFFSFQFDSNY